MAYPKSTDLLIVKGGMPQVLEHGRELREGSREYWAKFRKLGCRRHGQNPREYPIVGHKPRDDTLGEEYNLGKA